MRPTTMTTDLMQRGEATDADRALADLARRDSRSGYRVAFDLVGNRGEAEDAVQEALAMACAKINRLRDPAALGAWFRRVLVHHCLRVLRRRRFARALGWPLTRAVAVGVEDGERVMDLVCERPPPDEQLGERRRAAHTLRAVAALPSMQRAALVLRYGHDWPVAEIARALAVGEGTVKTHLVRGLARLRTNLEDAR